MLGNSMNFGHAKNKVFCGCETTFRKHYQNHRFWWGTYFVCEHPKHKACKNWRFLQPAKQGLQTKVFVHSKFKEFWNFRGSGKSTIFLQRQNWKYKKCVAFPISQKSSDFWWFWQCFEAGKFFICGIRNFNFDAPNSHCEFWRPQKFKAFLQGLFFFIRCN